MANTNEIQVLDCMVALHAQEVSATLAPKPKGGTMRPTDPKSVKTL